MDFAKFDLEGEAERGAVMEVADPVSGAVFLDEKGKPITITLAGQDSARFMECQRKQTQNMIDKRGKIKKDLSATENTAQILAACTLSWHGIDWEGKPLPCNYNNALMLFRTKHFVREQADQFVTDREHYVANL